MRPVPIDPSPSNFLIGPELVFVEDSAIDPAGQLDPLIVKAAIAAPGPRAARTVARTALGVIGHVILKVPGWSPGEKGSPPRIARLLPTGAYPISRGDAPGTVA